MIVLQKVLTLFDHTNTATGFGITDIENSDRWSPVSMAARHHANVSDSSTAMKSTTAQKGNMLPSDRKRPLSNNQKESNRISSLRNRQRKKALQYDLEQTVYTLMKHNQCSEEKNQNLTNLIHDAERCIIQENYNVNDTNF